MQMKRLTADMIAIYPGTFDPITNGHSDLARRAASLFDEVVVAIAEGEEKKSFFSLQERIELARQALRSYERIKVVGFSNLLVDFAQQLNARIIVRGLRAVSDFEYEFQLAGMNRHLNQELESVFLMPDEKYTYISSSLVREIASLKGDVSSFVSPVVERALVKRCRL